MFKPSILVNILITFVLMIFSLVLSLLPVSALANQVISLNKALSLALKQHPDLQSFVYKNEAAIALVEQAGVSTPMTISAIAEDALGTGGYTDINALQTTLSISWVLEQDIVDARVKLANSKVSSASIERQVKAIDIAADTASIFITLLSKIEKLKLAKLAERQAQAVLKQIGIKVKAGSLFVVDELRAKAALSLIELEVEDLIHEIEASKSQLAAQWGNYVGHGNLTHGNIDFVAKGNLATIPNIKALDAALENLQSNPKLKRFTQAQEVMQSNIDLARVEQQPAWSVSTGIKRSEAMDGFSVVAGISIPFGYENRNKGRIASLQAKQNQSKAEADALYQQISTQALLLTHKLKHNRHVIAGLTDKVIPYLEQANEKAQQAYKIGSYRYTDWYVVQQELIKAKSDLIDAYSKIHLFNIELERLIGTSVSM